MNVAKWAREMFGDALVALGIDLAFKQYAERKVVQQTFTADEREKLMRDILDLSSDEKNNLLKWHREADMGRAPLPWFTENEFATMLCKIQPDETTKSRKEILKKLNGLQDEEFWQMINILRHDPVRSNYEFLMREVHRVLLERKAQVKSAFADARAETKGVINTVIAAVDDRAKEAAPKLDDLADRIRGKKK